VEFEVIETAAPFGCVFLCHLEGMKERPLHYREIGQRALQPWFCHLEFFLIDELLGV
jgi:hypothetical protein